MILEGIILEENNELNLLIKLKYLVLQNVTLIPPGIS